MIFFEQIARFWEWFAQVTMGKSLKSLMSLYILKSNKSDSLTVAFFEKIGKSDSITVALT